MQRRPRWVRRILIIAVCAAIGCLYFYWPRINVRAVLGPRDARSDDKPCLYIIKDGQRQEVALPPESNSDNKDPSGTAVIISKPPAGPPNKPQPVNGAAK